MFFVKLVVLSWFSLLVMRPLFLGGKEARDASESEGCPEDALLIRGSQDRFAVLESVGLGHLAWEVME